MSLDIEHRISRLLDQLENESLDDVEVEKIKSKITYLKSLEE